MKYEIFYGFHSLSYNHIVECNNIEEAEHLAYTWALDLYQDYEGRNGVLSYEDIYHELKENDFYSVMNENEIQYEAESNYLEEVQNNIYYGVFLIMKT